MKRFVVFVFCLQFFGGLAAAQWVTSGSGIGERTGDQGLTSPSSLAQDIGYDSIEDMEAAAEQGYEANANDAVAWDYASSEQFDEDCITLFGSVCADVDADDFRPIVPQIQICIGLGFNNLTEMGSFVDGVEEQGGDEEDAANCKSHGYSASSADLQLCMIATNDDENAAACRARLGASASVDSDCSDLDRDDYEDIANNMAPRIVTPAGWQPSDVSAGAGQGAVLIDVLSAVDPDGDVLTWSLSAANPPVFAIDANSGVLSLSTDFGATAGGATRPENAQVTVQVSDGILNDNLTLNLSFQDDNGPPRIIVPADWSPGIIPNTASAGDQVISVLGATDPENDPLTWSITAMDYDVFAIDAQTGVVTIAEGDNAPEQQPESVSLTVQVSDGSLSDDLTLTIALADPNRPPRLIVPADWAPSLVSHDAASGQIVIDEMAATDPDGDTLTWSILSSDLDIFAINPQDGVMTLARENGLEGLDSRPEYVRFTVQVSDGRLTDEQALLIPLEAEKINTPPRIIVPEAFAENEFAPYPSKTTLVGQLQGEDVDGDPLTWSLLGGDPSIFSINSQTGLVSYTPLGSTDKLICVAATGGGTAGQSASRVAKTSGTTGFGIVSTNANVVQDHNANDFRSKKQNGPKITTRKYHVTLERANHRGGTFTTEARSATTYAVNDSGRSISVPALNAATVNSNVTPINSYLVFQNNSQIDLRNTDGVVTFENPILGIYYTDKGYDGTISRLGKPGAQYSRDYQQNKLALENGKDIAWIDPVDRRVLHFRSRTANIGDFMRVITTASNDGGGVEEDDDVEPVGPDECSAEITVQLSDGQATDETTLTLAFGDPNRRPQVFTPAGWTPSTISNTTDSGALVIGTLGAVDPDGDILKWSLDGDNADLFSIGSLDGKIRLSQAYGTASSLPSKANVTVRVTDGRLSDTLALSIPMEAKPIESSMASNTGTNGSFQFVSGNVQNIFNQDYTIMARFYHGSGGYSSRYYSWWPKKGWQTSPAKETIFFYGGNDNVGRKVQSGVSMHVFKDSIRLQLGTDYNFLETRTSIEKNRWHTVMFVVDADSRRKTSKYSWPVKIYLNGRLLGVNEFSTSAKNKQYAAVANASFAALGVAGRWKEQNDSRRPWARHLPLRNSSFIHEVSIWQGNKSNVAKAIYNNNRDVADYVSTAVGKPRYSWKPGLWGQSMTDDGDGTLTLANLANGKAEKGGLRAGNGISRLDGDMHLYPGRFSTVSGNAKAYTQWQGLSPKSYWHQGTSQYFNLLTGNGTRKWLSTYDKNDAGDVKAFTTGEMNGRLKTLNQ
ncbi:hypothetical protein N9Y79_04785 [Alphaproteobacteria bacterium]|nr:hypothetical protein [Alphaproteobacteria bacterium]